MLLLKDRKNIKRIQRKNFVLGADLSSFRGTLDGREVLLEGRNEVRCNTTLDGDFSVASSYDHFVGLHILFGSFNRCGVALGLI